MASYKVPQDVEADDKLLGPFSFRQFIYLIIVALAIAIAWALGTLFVGLAIIPLPVIILFGALALPLRKDQPMEIYLAAIVSFYLKPHFRLWDPDGIESTIEVSAPKVIEDQRTKDISGSEAEFRLNYLASIVDSQGWAIRGAANSADSPMSNDFFLEAQGATDVLDTNTSVAHSFDQMMEQSTERIKEEARERMFQIAEAPVPVTPFGPSVASQQPQLAPAAAVQPQGTLSPFEQVYSPAPTVPTVAPPLTPSPSQSPSLAPEPEQPLPQPIFNPYPQFNQSILQPLSQQGSLPRASQMPIAQTRQPSGSQPPAPSYSTPTQKENQPSTSDTTPNADIINLANNSEDLSVETIAHEAHRLKQKAMKESDEVIISLR